MGIYQHLLSNTGLWNLSYGDGDTWLPDVGPKRFRIKIGFLNNVFMLI